MNCSLALALILNIRNAADDHKRHCSENCNVSLYSLKDAARYISGGAWESEQAEVAKLMANWPY